MKLDSDEATLISIEGRTPFSPPSRVRIEYVSFSSQSNRLALREVEAGLRLVLLVDVGRPKIGESVFSVQINKHGAYIPHHMIVSLPRQIRDLAAAHGQANLAIHSCFCSTFMGFLIFSSALALPSGVLGPVLGPP